MLTNTRSLQLTFGVLLPHHESQSHTHATQSQSFAKLIYRNRYPARGVPLPLPVVGSAEGGKLLLVRCNYRKATAPSAHRAR